ncbi:hypothetical protein ACLOJK_013914 [Asimina triloba]
MEMIKDIIPLIWLSDKLSDSISEHLGFIIDLKGNIATLMNETNELKRKREEFEEDVMEAESIGKKRLRRVDDWFIDVDKIIPEIESIKLEFDQLTISPFWWHKLGKRVVNKIKDVKKLQDKGVFDEVAKSPQPPAHQRTWEAQLAENVYLGTAVGRVEVELFACRIRLAKLEAELSCLKAQRDSVTDGSAGAAAAVPPQTAKRPGRAKRPIASVSSLPSADDQR